MPILTEEQQGIQHQLYIEGHTFYKSGQYQKAIDSLNKALAMSNQHANSHFIKGLALDCLNKTQEALEEFNTTILQNDTHADGWYYLGLMSYKKAETAEPQDAYNHLQVAVTCIDRAVSLNKNHPAAEMMLEEVKKMQAEKKALMESQSGSMQKENVDDLNRAIAESLKSLEQKKESDAQKDAIFQVQCALAREKTDNIFKKYNGDTSEIQKKIDRMQKKLDAFKAEGYQGDEETKNKIAIKAFTIINLTKELQRLARTTPKSSIEKTSSLKFEKRM